MGLLGTIGGGIVGFVLGGPVGAVGGAILGNQMEDGANKAGAEAAQPHYPPAVDYSAAMMVGSDDAKTTALAQIMAQQFAIQQSSMDRQAQAAVSLELGLERLDTRLQTAKLDYFAMMRSEENRHIEKMTELKSSRSADFPEPSAEWSL